MPAAGRIDNILLDRSLIFLVADHGYDRLSILYIFIHVPVYL